MSESPDYLYFLKLTTQEHEELTAPQPLTATREDVLRAAQAYHERGLLSVQAFEIVSRQPDGRWYAEPISVALLNPDAPMG